jgi:hypothetical protein
MRVMICAPSCVKPTTSPTDFLSRMALGFKAWTARVALIASISAAFNNSLGCFTAQTPLLIIARVLHGHIESRKWNTSYASEMGISAQDIRHSCRSLIFRNQMRIGSSPLSSVPCNEICPVLNVPKSGHWANLVRAISFRQSSFQK